jgi:hypothetical protein
MSIEQISTFLSTNSKGDLTYVKIFFKRRDAVFGVFVTDKDFQELKFKNFWRIVTLRHLDDYIRSNDMSLSRIFSGSEFSRLARYEDAP